MEKFKHIQRIKEIYANGGNIIKFLKTDRTGERNTIEDILISYDLQAGAYTQHLAKNYAFKVSYSKALANVLKGLGQFDSVMEVGVGEATTLAMLIKNMDRRPKHLLGFDISWSRLKFAKELLQGFGIDEVELFTADLFEIPLMDNSVDIVYTSHSIEPNGGREEAALKELARVAKKYVVLLEPSSEFASEEARNRMKAHGYVSDLRATAEKLGLNVTDHRLFDLSANPLNPTGLMVIEKDPVKGSGPELVCPVTHTPLAPYDRSLLFSAESCLAYPVIDGIPCLLKDNAILATHLLTNYEEFRSTHGVSFNG